MHQSVGAFHQDQLLAGAQGIVFIDLRAVGDNFVVLQGFHLDPGDPDGHAVVGFAVQTAGQHIRRTQGHIQRGQHIGHGSAVGTDHRHLAAFMDRDHLNTVDMNFRDPIIPLGGIGV